MNDDLRRNAEALVKELRNVATHEPSAHRHWLLKTTADTLAQILEEKAKEKTTEKEAEI